MHKKRIATTLLILVSIIWITTNNAAPQSSSPIEADYIEASKQSSILELTPDNVHQTIANFPTILIVYFYAEWCGYCKAMKPTFEWVAREYKDMYSFAKVNIDQSRVSAQGYTISSIPTIAIFSKGKLIDKITGSQSKKSLAERIKQAVIKSNEL